MARQDHEEGCGAACVVMLLADRGIEVTQDLVTIGLVMPSDAEDLADRLCNLSGSSWCGGSLEDGTTVRWELIDFISSTRGTWAALVEPFGPSKVGHWVVVDGVGQEGLVLVRDPVGMAYGVPLATFARLWGYTILVMEDIRP